MLLNLPLQQVETAFSVSSRPDGGAAHRRAKPSCRQLQVERVEPSTEAPVRGESQHRVQ